MIKHTVTLLFVIVGLINFAPLMGVTGQTRLEALYGTVVPSADLLLLLRHRAILFGIIGGFILIAAFKHAFRSLAAVFGYISMISYVGLALIDKTINANLDRVMQIDIVALILLTAALLIDRRQEYIVKR